MTILLGPAGTGGNSLEGIQTTHNAGLNATEIEFTHGVYMSDELAKKCGELAKKLDVRLSVHAPYFINLASEDKKKIEASKKRILDSCERGHFLGAKYVVVHAGYYGKRSREECYQLIKKAIIDIKNEIKKRKLDIEIAPEVMGKHSQFGDLDELLRMKKETGCHLCIDFAHLRSRNNGKVDYETVFEKLRKAGIKSIHAHFSGIEFNEKGERKHLMSNEPDIKELLEWIKKSKIDATIINESPEPLKDSIKSKHILDKL